MSLDSGYDSDPRLAELYDSIPLYHSRRDLEFFVNLCREAGEVLELGCGTGRVLIPAAEAGASITGLDQAAGMLARCRAKVLALPPEVARRVTLVQGDMTSFHLGRSFPLIIVPFRPVQHLITVDEQLRFLECVREHLSPGDKLVFDAFHPNLGALAAPLNPEEIEDTPELQLGDGRTVRRTYRLVRKHPAEQYNDVELIYYLDGRRIVQEFPMRYFFRYELEHLLVRSGFKATALYGDYDKSALSDESPDMIFTAVRA
jgi:SAM-dependent methyltransferase